MRNFKTLNFKILTAACILSAGAALAGCAMPRHQDAIFFGTDTKVAFDVGVQPENGNTPSLTLGYKRREFVYMPLAEYGPADNLGLLEAIALGDLLRKDKKPPAKPTPKNDSKNVPPDRHAYKGSGSNTNQSDSYSVFATFGGNFNGGGDAGAKIKQVFATGIAAQIAATQGADFVRPHSPDARITNETIRMEKDGVQTRADNLTDDEAMAVYTLINSGKTGVELTGQAKTYFDAQGTPSDGGEAKQIVKALIELTDFSKSSVSQGWAKLLPAKS